MEGPASILRGDFSWCHADQLVFVSELIRGECLPCAIDRSAVGTESKKGGSIVIQSDWGAELVFSAIKPFADFYDDNVLCECGIMSNGLRVMEDNCYLVFTEFWDVNGIHSFDWLGPAAASRSLLGEDKVGFWVSIG